MPVADDPARTVVAAFDVDGTVTVHDCVVPFVRRVAGTSRVVAGLALDVRRVVPALVRRDRDAIKARASRAAFRGRCHGDIEAAGRAFAQEIVRHDLRPDVIGRLAWHRAAGHATVLVSASYGAYLRPLAASLGVDGVVGTELEVDAAGRCTGDLVDGNCRGPAKVRRLHVWLDEHAGGRGAVELWAYGDSPGDRELLADADHPVWARDVVVAATPQVVGR